MITDFSESGTLIPMHVPMKNFGTDGVLTTREAGARARHEIERHIGTLMPGQPVALDFADVRAVSVPFADEAVGQLLSGWLSGYYEEHPILAFNASEDVRETIAAALRQRRLLLLGLHHGDAELLGADAVLDETMRVAQRLGSFSAADLAQELGLTPQAANNRLKTLMRSGALRRTRVAPSRGGKEFAYEVPPVPPSPFDRGGGSGGVARPRRTTARQTKEAHREAKKVASRPPAASP